MSDKILDISSYRCCMSFVNLRKLPCTAGNVAYLLDLPSGGRNVRLALGSARDQSKELGQL